MKRSVCNSIKANTKKNWVEKSGTVDIFRLQRPHKRYSRTVWYIQKMTSLKEKRRRKHV